MNSTFQTLASRPFPQMNVRFAGTKEFAEQLGVNPELVERALPALVSALDLLPTLKAVDPAVRAALIKDVQKLQSTIPLGTVDHKSDPDNVVITSYDNDKGEAVTTKIPKGNRPVIAGPEVSMKDFMEQALGPDPKVVICPVGWTVPSPQVLAQHNPNFADKLKRLEAQVTDSVGAGNPALPKKLEKAAKLLAGEVYEKAFQIFWEPIDEYLFNERKLDPAKFAFLTSASYDGIDKAAMVYAESKNMPVVNVTPFAYANWMETKLPHALKISNTIDDYALDCSKGAGMLVVTGGRDHAWSKDVSNFLIKEKKLVIPADILNEAMGFHLPATRDGKVDNAARMLQDMGLSVSTGQYAKNVRSNGKLTEFQQDVAGAIETLYNQITTGDTAAIAAKLAAK